MAENIKDTISKALMLFPKVLVQDNETCALVCEVSARLAIAGALGKPMHHRELLSCVYVEALAQLPHPEIPQPAPRGAVLLKGQRIESHITARPIIDPLPPPFTQYPLTTSFMRMAVGRANILRSSRESQRSVLAKLPQLPPPDLVNLVNATKKNSLMRERRLALSSALAKHGLEVRSDSHYCQNFIYDGSPSIRKVVRQMREMAFYLKRTRYLEFHQIFCCWFDNLTAERLAKEQALASLIRKLGLDEVLHMKEIPRRMRSEIELAGGRCGTSSSRQGLSEET